AVKRQRIESDGNPAIYRNCRPNNCSRPGIESDGNPAIYRNIRSRESCSGRKRHFSHLECESLLSFYC
ncbi:MAG: hypothetical protein ACUVQG_06275, partial [Thermogutta sp.]